MPHWEVEDGRYFITLHLAGAIPAAGRLRLRAQAKALQGIPRTDAADWIQAQRAIFAEMERWLDRGTWNPHFKHPQVANATVEAIEHRRSVGEWIVHAYVIMPTHVHLFLELGEERLQPSLENFKRWTTRQAIEILSLESKRFWQSDWFDHWSRSDAEDDRIVSYIQDNPVKAGLVSRYTDWPYGSWAARPNEK